MRFPSHALPIVASALLVVVACNRGDQPVVKTTDSVSTTTVIPGTAAPADTSRYPISQPQANATVPAGSAASSDSVQSRVLPDDDPIARQMLQTLKDQRNWKPQQGVVLPKNVINSARLAELQPKILGYEPVAQPSNFDGQGQGRSTELLRSTSDPTRTIRVIIKSDDETMPSSFSQKINELRQAGQLTDNSQGEPITAYYLQVGGQPAAKAYIPSKHVATLTVFVGDHRLVQLREDKVSSADHLVEVSKYLDIKRLAALKP